MKNSPSARLLRIPVNYVDGVWECGFGGGAIPVKRGTKAELVLDRQSIADKEFLETMERRDHHKVLDEGACLLVSLSIKSESRPTEQLRQYLKDYDSFKGSIAPRFLDTLNPATLSFVEVRLGGPDESHARRFKTDRGGLWLITQGAQAIGLASTTVILPEAVSAKPLASLNHAFTKLSEAYETWRISHTGNIYSRVFYQERNGQWCPLDLLRREPIIKKEQEIASDLWEHFMIKMSGSRRPANRK